MLQDEWNLPYRSTRGGTCQPMLYTGMVIVQLASPQCHPSQCDFQCTCYCSPTTSCKATQRHYTSTQLKMLLYRRTVSRLVLAQGSRAMLYSDHSPPLNSSMILLFHADRALKCRGPAHATLRAGSAVQTPLAVWPSVSTEMPALHRLANSLEYCIPYWSSLPHVVCQAPIIACIRRGARWAPMPCSASDPGDVQTEQNHRKRAHPEAVPVIHKWCVCVARQRRRHKLFNNGLRQRLGCVASQVGEKQVASSILLLLTARPRLEKVYMSEFQRAAGDMSRP